MKRLINLMMCAVSLGAAAQLPDYVPTDGLVAWYPLDGNGLDFGPSGLHGIENGSVATASRHGVLEGAILLDGNSNIDLGNSDLMNPSDALTFSAWFRLDAVNPQTGLSTILGRNKDEYGSGYCYNLGLEEVGEELELRFGLNVGLEEEPVFDFNVSVDFDLNEWCHYVASYSSASGFMTLYLNGLLAGELEIGGIAIDQTSAPTLIGFYRPNGDHSFIGVIDDLGIWDRTLTTEEILGLYNAPAPSEGCADSTACNYDADANLDDGSCHFLCQYCKEGTVWDEDIQGCIVANPSDSNFDGCVQLNDLLDLLSAYGDCAAEESAWQCGDPLEYQGYNYATVQIGEQCWFAENVRFLPQVSPPDLGSEIDGQPHAYVYGFGGNDVEDAMIQENYILYGALYNYQSLTDWQLCPSGWHVGNDEDFSTLELFAGMDLDQVNLAGGIWRGVDEGYKLKSNDDGDIWIYDGGDADNNGGGSDQFGFSGIPSGGRLTSSPQAFFTLGSNLNLWTPPFARSLAANEDGIWRRAVGDNVHPEDGLSIRCIKDTE